MRNKLYLVSCTKRKNQKSAMCKDVYNSVLFNMIKSRVEGQEWYILSAKYYLLHPTTLIKPYDVTLNTMSKQERKTWSEHVVKNILSVAKKDQTVVILAGNKYREFIEPLLTEHDIIFEVPLKGMGIGQQQKYIKENGLL